MNKNYEKIVSLVCDTLVEAGSTFREDKKKAYKRVIASVFTTDYYSIFYR